MSESATINDVYRELMEIKEQMISKKEMAGIIDTLEILHNHKTMSQIHSSESDIKLKRIKTVNTVKDLLAEQ